MRPQGLARRDLAGVVEGRRTGGRTGGRARGGEQMDHEIIVILCRWCHAKVHKSGARINDEVEPDRKALEMMEERKSAEMDETKFESAREMITFFFIIKYLHVHCLRLEHYIFYLF